TIRVSNIKSRSSSGRSLMPEGFEQLGAEGMRDMLTYLCADESRFRILDLSKAFTANNSRGLFITPDNREDTIAFRKYGLLKADDVPFDVISPDKAVANVIVLKGGDSRSWSRQNLPQSVEIPVGIAAAQLHFLGGVAGWGHPLNPDADAAKVTIQFAGGAKEIIMLKNGREFADYNGRADVPGSKMLESWIRGRGQIRWFSKPVSNPAVIEKLTIESFNNGVAPVFFAVTADTEKSGAKVEIPVAKPAARIFEWGTGIKTLVVGGGSSHDFNRFFNLADKKTLEEGGFASVNYTENFTDMAANMKAADVLQYNTNKEITDPAEKRSILDHLAAGKGMVIVHAGAWYNQKGWLEFNTEIIGGGSRGHDRLGEFEVKVTDAAHPVMKGVPASFSLVDELYYLEPEPKSTPIQVLAEAHSATKNKTYPSVYVVKHPKARIVVITLGHDARAHDLDAYKTLLKNAISWVKVKN
ncbi:MAG: ThuA domain-containing protein, partial [Opitutaceae bacterium]|nr:ThuA domain-containing protein [Verrucomicrobiales bacterium]